MAKRLKAWLTEYTLDGKKYAGGAILAYTRDEALREVRRRRKFTLCDTYHLVGEKT